ncbi:hypothetical protein [Aquincola sp. J276]|uniref:hypothetical protein n=1 Tax=Aquincola sp. J276 TaxID=2898432 RepID=UPI00215119A0|nr:hypothetical protein [Aquincola sp. J276]MCR5868478.1 hypothetical protein [Aquincola sp. J276]
MATLSTKNVPVSQVAKCSELEAIIKRFVGEAERAKADPKVVGQEQLERVLAERKVLQASIKAAEAALANAKIDLAFDGVNVGIGATLAGLGLVFTSPLAVGVLAGATMLAGVSSFAAQAFFRQGPKEVAFVMGYARDRGLMLTGMLAQNASSSMAKLVGNAANATAIFVAAYEYNDHHSNKDQALSALKLALVRLKAVDAGVGELGNDAKKWGELYRQQALAGSKVLREYVDANKATNCLFVEPAGARLRKP